MLSLPQNREPAFTSHLRRSESEVVGKVRLEDMALPRTSQYVR